MCHIHMYARACTYMYTHTPVFVLPLFDQRSFNFHNRHCCCHYAIEYKFNHVLLHNIFALMKENNSHSVPSKGQPILDLAY